MDKYMIDNKCINFSRLLLLRAKELGISDPEAHILMIILLLQDMQVKTITPMLITEYSTKTSKQLDDVLKRLIKKNLIINRKGNIKLNHLEELLLTNQKPQMVEVNIVSIFEDELGRPLSPMELETIKEWKNENYSDENIIRALKEAVKANALNMRYIEAILINWEKTGVKTYYTNQKVEASPREVSNYHWWEDLDE